MIRLTRHADVTALELFTARSRLISYSVHVYLVRGALVDTGSHAVRRDVARLVDEVRPRGAFVTHSHEDHAGNVELLARRGVPLAMSALTAQRVRHVDPIGLYRRFTWESMPPLRATPTPFAPDDLQLVPAPGHSADHHVVWDASTRTLFAGDLFLGVKVRLMHPSEDPYAIIASLRAAIALGPERMFCAHRGAVSRPAEMLGARAEWLASTVGEIERRIARGVDDDRAIAREVLGPEPLTGIVSRGEYAHVNVVRAVRIRLAGGERAAQPGKRSTTEHTGG
jgi:glyoxylase-like metal-dependent hydrolase (beta-lactamase superfamily II)